MEAPIKLPVELPLGCPPNFTCSHVWQSTPAPHASRGPRADKQGQAVEALLHPRSNGRGQRSCARRTFGGGRWCWVGLGGVETLGNSCLESTKLLTAGWRCSSRLHRLKRQEVRLEWPKGITQMRPWTLPSRGRTLIWRGPDPNQSLWF